ncbi:MAG: molybdopterin molybdotransferase MoeA [Oligoflexia bacterium]|nr:molybdopterin molybdotransferase MoeA [Oligoflexia bacterium]MBF0367148.1 molybdopterin molybdotransferase MoeA [Oligoflexia bacterium]
MTIVKDAYAVVKNEINNRSWWQMQEAVCLTNFKRESFCRVLAEDIIARRDAPPFAKALMDGIAISKNYQENSWLQIIGTIRAGDAKEVVHTLSNKMQLTTDAAIEIMTGAPVPENCMAIIPYEEIVIAADRVTQFPDNVLPGQNIARGGSDYRKGDLLFRRGGPLCTGTTGVLLSQGIFHVKVNYCPEVVIVSTGDEIALPEEQVEVDDYRIRASNPFVIAEELLALGLSKISWLHLKDNEEEMQKGIGKILGKEKGKEKIILLIGGVSKGKFDYVPTVLEKLKVSKLFHRVQQRPGRPFYFGVSLGGDLLFGLPGNPLSALMVLRRYLVTAWSELLHGEEECLVEFPRDYWKELRLQEEFCHFIPVKLACERKGYFIATPCYPRNSGDELALRGTDGFVEISWESLLKSKELSPGDEKLWVPYYQWVNR